MFWIPWRIDTQTFWKLNFLILKCKSYLILQEISGTWTSAHMIVNKGSLSTATTHQLSNCGHENNILLRCLWFFILKPTMTPKGLISGTIGLKGRMWWQPLDRKRRLVINKYKRGTRMTNFVAEYCVAKSGCQCHELDCITGKQHYKKFTTVICFL